MGSSYENQIFSTIIYKSLEKSPDFSNFGHGRPSEAI